MAGSVGNAEVDGHRVDEGRFGQRHAACAEVRRHLEGQAVTASGHGAGVKQRPAVVAAVVVEGDALDRFHALAGDALQRHLHACGGAAIHGVQNVGAEVAHGVISR